MKKGRRGRGVKNGRMEGERGLEGVCNEREVTYIRVYICCSTRKKEEREGWRGRDGGKVGGSQLMVNRNGRMEGEGKITAR